MMGLILFMAGLVVMGCVFTLWAYYMHKKIQG